MTPKDEIPAAVIRHEDPALPGASAEAVWSRAEPESPCRRICVIHPESGLCVGCLRSRAEIAGWLAMGSEARRAILADLPGREGRLTRRRGGRAARTKLP